MEKNRHHHSPNVTRHPFLLGALFLFLFLGCNLVAPSTGTPFPTPTTNPIFAGGNDDVTRDSAESSNGTQTPIPTQRPSATPSPIPTQAPTPTELPPIILFDDTLHPDWELVNSNMPHDTRHNGEAFTGTYSLQLSPSRGRQVMLLTVRQDAGTVYRRDDFLGITFRLYSGDNFVGIDDLAVAVIGSNEVPYWVPNDPTATNLDPDFEPDDPSIVSVYDYAFSPTRLQFLGITNDVPPETWVWATNWLDDRVFDIEYEFITGFYIKNDDGFTQDVLIDDIRLVLAPLATPTPSPIITITP